ncbi:tandem-95 repeat protein [Hoeflea prorocentri]|uniref:Tandem-95 repeat protein n=1 Tax=Hoeflea prorocentri TaxID=1922333 RepID=A0A9X3ZIF6_9HYPH|nr:tandem-95 repeat protein [Hoeflea prorocentri]MCY6381796.1 tandem-95 repeat protein [Hoeflea prorocentri]MDA5399596.1 tandem-95 repeat protein [Hoeflea prorocentri]
MAVRIVSRLGKVGSTFDNAANLVDATSAVAGTVSTLSEDDPDPLGTTLEILSTFGAIAATIREYKGLTEDTRKELQKAIKILKEADEAGEAFGRALVEIGKIPNPLINKLATAIVTGQKTFSTTEDQFQFALKELDAGLKVLDTKLAKVLKVVDNVGSVAGVAELIYDLYNAVVKEQGTVFGVFLNTFIPTFGFEIPDPTAQGGSEPGVALPVADANQNVADEVGQSFDVFSARLQVHTNKMDDLNQSFANLIETIKNLVPEANLDNPAAYLEGEIIAAIDRASSILETDLPLDAINEFAEILEPLDDIVGVLEAVQEAIQPVLDFFGPVLSIIDKVIDGLSDALGLSALEAKIKELIQDQIDDLTQPIRDKIDDAVDEITGSIVNAMSDLLNQFVDIKDQLLDLALNPGIEVGDRQGISNDVLNGEAMAAGGAGDDIIMLQLDSRFSDGHGGMALGGDGNDRITGTSLIDIINGGAGSDIISGLAGDDKLFGGTGSEDPLSDEGDIISGGAGNDAIFGSNKNDLLIGGTGNDAIYGDSGNDQIFGDDGNDLLDGEDGEDTLEGGLGDDILNGGADNDILIDTSGNNILDGGEGLDEIRTLGDVSAVNTILDTTAVLRGGAGREILQFGDALAVGSDATPGAFFDGGANTDIVEVGNIDLDRLSAVLENFETLKVTAQTGEEKTIALQAESLRSFDQVELLGEGAFRFDIRGGTFDTDMMFTDQSLLIDWSSLTPVSNAQNGPSAGQGGRPISLLAPVTFQLNGNLGETGGTVIGSQRTKLGMVFEGSDGDDLIVGGAGSDVIRGGLGADILDGGSSDTGDRFDLESAVGDVILGTVEELNGDTIRNLSNRVDKVRIEGSEDYHLTFDTQPGQTIVAVYLSQAAFDAGDAALGSFTLEGDYPKLFSQGGSYIAEDGTETSYVEVFNNNVPPTAVNDLVVSRYQGEGDTPQVIDPFANDFDVDTPADPSEGIVRRQIAVTESLAALFRTIDIDDEDAARQAFADGITPVAIGTELLTEAGNKLIFTADGIVYEAPEQSVTFRDSQAGDAGLLGFFGVEGFYDTSEALPFFGWDRISYKVFDLDGELSNTANVDILIRPDRVTLADGTRALPSVGITATGANPGNYVATLTDQTGQNIGQDLIDSSGDADSSNHAVGHDYFYITDPGSYQGLGGTDVMDGRDATGALRLFGGTGADWVEGGDFDDLLSGGGYSDSYNPQSMRAEGDAPEQGNILIGNGGNNVYSASSGGTAGETQWLVEAPRDTTYILNGGAETISGTPLTSRSGDGVNFDPFFGLKMGAAALQDDRIIGFDNDDQIALALSDDTLTGVGFTSQAYVAPNVFIPLRTGMILTELDMTSELGKRNKDIIGESRFINENGFFEGHDFQTTFDFALSGPQGQGSFWYEQPGFDGFPQIVSYAIEAVAIDENGAAAPQTELTISLKSFRFDVENRLQSHIYADLIEDPELLDPFNLDNDPFFHTNISRATDLIPGAHVSFSMILDGAYQDRFVLDVTSGMAGGAGEAPLIFTDLGTHFSDQPYAYEYVTDDEISAAEALGKNIALSIRYDSSAPVAVADTAQLARGRAVTFDLLANDTDADGDVLRLFDIEFESAGQEADLLDGDTSNGELILQTDPNTGFGTGIVTYVAAPDYIGDVNFSYIATDGEYQSEAQSVSINVTGLAPVLGDDRIVLKANSDAVGSAELLPGGTRFIPLSVLTANDVDPDLAEALNSQSFDVTGASFIRPPFGEDPFEDIRAGTDIAFGRYPGNGEYGVFLRGSLIDALSAGATSPTGTTGASTSFTYTLEDAGEAGRSNEAHVEVFVAADFALAPNGTVSVAEDASIALDIVSGRSGGFGDVEILSASAALGEGTTTEVGTVEIYGDGIIFTPSPDIFGVTALIDVVVADQLGSTETIPVRIEITPSEDAPEVRNLSATGGANSLATDEDTAVEGLVTLFDLDELDPAVLGVQTALDMAEALRNNTPELIDPADLALIADKVLAPADLGPIVTTQGGSFQLTASASPLVYSYEYTPAADFEGSDSVAIDWVAPDGTTGSVVWDIDVTGINDAPIFTTDDPTSDAPETLDVASDLELNLLDDVTDVDGNVDPASVVIENAPDPLVATIAVSPDGTATITGVGSGPTQFSYSVADEAGLRSETRTVYLDVNEPPEAVDDNAIITAPGQRILIDAITNDTDGDGDVSYVLGPDGLPQALDPQQTLDPNAAPGLLGSVEWSVADGAFIYTAPTDPALFGQTDVFYYEVQDNDGTTSRAAVFIELTSPEAPALRLGTNDADDVAARESNEEFFLGAGADSVQGTLINLDGDQIYDFDPDDTLIVEGLSADDITITTSRIRTEKPPVISVAALTEIPSVAGLFGGVTVEELRSAFVGNTMLEISTGTEVSTIVLNGAYLGTFEAVNTPEGNVAISYKPTTGPDPLLNGSPNDNDLQASEANTEVAGEGGDDVVQTQGAAASGGAGEDAIIALGAAAMQGGADADLFVIGAAGTDTVLEDFNPYDGDRIAISIPAYINDDGTMATDRLSITRDEDGVLTLWGNPDLIGDVEPPVLEQLARFTLPEGLNAGIDGARGDEDTEISGTVADNVSEIGGDAKTFAVETDPANGHVVMETDGSYTYTPNANFFGTDSFTYRVTLATDGGQLTDTATVEITIDLVNDAPTLEAPLADVSSAEDTPLEFSIPPDAFADIEGTELALSATLTDASDLPDWLDFDAETGTFSGLPPKDFNGPVDVRVTAFDGEHAVSDDFTLDITPVNDKPVTGQELADQSFDEDTAVSFTLPADAFDDVDGDTLALSVELANGEALPGWLGFEASTGTFSGQPPLNFNGNLDVVVIASDGELEARSAFSLEITPVNDAPVANTDTGFEVDAGASLVFSTADILANDTDADGDALSVVSVTGAENGSLQVASDGTIIYTPAADFDGVETLTYEVFDGTETSEGEIQINVIGTATDPYEGWRQGTDGNDVLLGSLFAQNQIYGGDGNDLIIGGFRSDELAGGDGNDLIFGGFGNDDITGGAGRDFLIGGAGRDTFNYASGAGIDIIADFDTGRRWFSSGGDRITIDVDGVDSFDALLAHASQVGRHTVFDFGNGDLLVLNHTRLSALDGDAFSFF